jgi:hypothetical protein
LAVRTSSILFRIISQNLELNGFREMVIRNSEVKAVMSEDCILLKSKFEYPMFPVTCVETLADFNSLRKFNYLCLDFMISDVGEISTYLEMMRTLLKVMLTFS